MIRTSFKYLSLYTFGTMTCPLAGKPHRPHVCYKR